jgi:hypothetical protein
LNRRITAFSALPLLVATVGADHPYDAFAPDDFAVFAKLFDGRAHFHFSFL